MLRFLLAMALSVGLAGRVNAQEIFLPGRATPVARNTPVLLRARETGRFALSFLAFGNRDTQRTAKIVLWVVVALGTVGRALASPRTMDAHGRWKPVMLGAP
jgi:hypothetical protein